MGYRPLAVVQFSEFGDGELPTYLTARHGWGRDNPVNMHHVEGEWTEFAGVAVTAGTPWVRRRGRVVNGRFSPPHATPIPPLAEDRIIDACQLILDTPLPAAGRLEAQLAIDPGIDAAALSILGPFVLLHSGIGVVSADGQHGIALIRVSLGAGVVVYTWSPGGSDIQSPLDDGDLSASFDADGLGLGIEWAGGVYQCTAAGRPVCQPRTLTPDPSEMSPMLVSATYGGYPDYSGITWAALSEEAPLLVRPAEVGVPVRTGWSLHAADRWGRERDEIRPDTWTWTDRLNEPSTVSWSQQVGGPKITAYATYALVCHRGRRYHVGPVTTQDRSHGPDPGVARAWSATDRRGQLNMHRTYPTHRLSFNGVSLRDVVTHLLDDTQVLPGGDMGIRVHPDMPAGPAITLDVEVRSELGAALGQAFELAGGEWTIDRRDLLRWWPEGRGGRPDWIAHINSADEHLDGDGFGTALWVTGADSAVAVYRQAPNVGSRAEGRIDLVLSDPESRDPAALAARADRAIAEAAVLRPSHTVELVPGTWSPSDARPGDTCRLIDPPLGTDEWVRIYEIAVTVTKDGAETVRVAYGAPTPSFWRDLARQRRTVDRLARR